MAVGEADPVRPPDRCRRARSLSGQGGFGLVEVLVATILVSLLVMALATGLLLVVDTTGSTGERQTAQLALANFAESMKSLGYLPCGSGEDYRTAFAAWPDRWEPDDGAVVELVDVEYWHKGPRNGAGEYVAGEGSFQPQCHLDGATAIDDGAQRLTLRATYRRAIVDTQIVKVAR